MRDYIEIGSSPAGESCAQMGADNFERLSKIECRVFKNQLERMFPDGVFGVKSFPHDYGNYREVVAYYEDGNEKMTDAAFAAERQTPEFWDALAEEELHEAQIEAGV